jgi:hypothetical protein
MNVSLPKYMSIGDFCKYSGFSRYQFMRLADKAGVTIIPLTADRRSKMVDVQEALRKFEALAEADKEMPVYLQQASVPAEEAHPDEEAEAAE